MTYRIHDLSMPVTDTHFRWSTPRTITGDHSETQPFQVTRLSLSCHSFTHVDARRHMLPDTPTIEETPLEEVAGPCFVADISDVTPNEALGADRLNAALQGHDGEGIILLRSCWDQQRDWQNADYWRDAPYITREGAETLALRAPKAIAFDFPQDYTIRLSLDGIVPPITEHVTHDVLLRRGITLIEYLINTAPLTVSRCFLCALPIKVAGADGAPARVVAFDGAPFNTL